MLPSSSIKKRLAPMTLDEVRATNIKWMSLADAAKYFDVTMQTAYTWVKLDKVTARTCFGRIVIDVDSVRQNKYDYE